MLKTAMKNEKVPSLWRLKNMADWRGGWRRSSLDAQQLQLKAGAAGPSPVTTVTR